MNNHKADQKQNEHRRQRPQNRAEDSTHGGDCHWARLDRRLALLQRREGKRVADKLDTRERGQTEGSWNRAGQILSLAFLFHEAGNGAHQIVFGEDFEFGAVHFDENGGIFVTENVGDALNG